MAYIPEYGSIRNLIVGFPVCQHFSWFIREVNDNVLPSKLIVVEVGVLLVLQLS
jgi:hypothetical protein